MMDRLRADSEGSLREKLRRLIAEKQQIEPEQVSVEYIRAQRKRLIYPSARYEVDSRRGGYDSDGLDFYSQAELSLTEADVTAELSQVRTG